MATPIIASILKNKIAPNFHLLSMRVKLGKEERSVIDHIEDIDYMTSFQALRLVTEDERLQFHVNKKKYKVLREFEFGCKYSAYICIDIGVFSDKAISAMNDVVGAYRETERLMNNQ